MKRLASVRNATLGTALALLLFGGTYTGVAYAGQRAFGPPPGGRGMMMGGPGGMFMGRFGQQLGLTDAQRQQIRSIMQQNRDQIAPLAKAVRDARQGLMDAARGGGDDAALQSKAADLGTAESQLALATAKVQAQIFTQVLTPDQQKKALELRDQMKQRMQQRPRGQRWQRR
jgi:Spy/CpxP family protein refolding chaperone